MKVAICDDSLVDRTFVKQLTETWANNRSIEIEIDTFTSSESFLFHYADHKEYDLLLLDIEMGEIDGVNMAKYVRNDNEFVQIIFITGYSEYIAEGYEVEALNYLMKPLKADKLCSVLDRAIYKIHQNDKMITLEFASEMVRIPLHEIRYVDVLKNYITIHAKSDYTIKRSLGDMEQELDERFFRASRSLILNLKKIRRVTKQEVHLSDGTKLPLPRGAYEKLNRAIITYI